MDLSILWKQAAAVFPYFGRLDLDWDGLYREYLDKVMQTQTDRECVLLYAEFLNRLGDGHTEYFLPKALLDETGYLPFRLQYAGGKYYADGEEVLEINGRPFGELLNLAFRYIYHIGAFTPSSRLQKILPQFLNRTGNVLVTDGGSRNFDLLDQPLPNPQREYLAFREYGDTLYIQIDDFLHAGAADAIRPKLAGKRTVILDIRENIGGMTLYGAQVAELFISGEFGACKKFTQNKRAIDLASASQYMLMSEEELEETIRNGLGTRDSVEWSRRVWNHAEYQEYEDSYGGEDHEALFNGPVVLLTSRNTVSAAEDFAAMFQTNRRAAFVGTSTCGTSGTPLIQRLTYGGFRICSVGYRLLDGTEFIGKGIQPDVWMEPNMDDLRQGRDPVLDFALEMASKK